MNHMRKGYALVRPATKGGAAVWRLAFFGIGGRDAFGRWSWQETKSVNGVGFVDASDPTDPGAKLLRQQTTLSVRPMVLPLFPFTVGDNFHPIFIAAFSDNGKPCWIDSAWYAWSIDAATYGLGTPA